MDHRKPVIFRFIRSRAIIILVFLLVISGMVVLTNCSHPPANVSETHNAASIYPEYYDLTIPLNIAPLNFIIKELGSKYRIEISAGNGKSIEIQQKSPAIKIPLHKWRKMLSENAGETLSVDIWTFHNNTWIKYPTIRHHISEDPIDPYLAYRLVHSVYLRWYDMGIYQRDISSFRERPVIVNTSTDHGCMNCHSFLKNDPSRMLIHFRILHAGTLILNGDTLSIVNTKTPDTMSPGVYPSWHPDGKHIAFSVCRLSPRLTTRSDKVVDVADKVSDIILYNTENNSVSTPSALSTTRRESMPAWSPDGRYLYFISAPEAIEGDDESLLHARYDLMRIAYDAQQDSWGEVETVLNSDSTGMSISKPSISPDGKYLICSMSDYGYFTIFHKKSDLYSVDLETGEYKKLDINSNSAESHSSWSSNGRWLVFSSKRLDDVYTRPFIAYFNRDGTTGRPFVLPRKDPEMYYRLLANYNLPELITGKIDLAPIGIRDLLYKKSREQRGQESQPQNTYMYGN